MGRKGEKKHLKRKPAPKIWSIHRKEFVWTMRPNPGPHPIMGCMPLALIVRDVLDFAKTRREAKMIIFQGKINVDGKTRREDLFPTGLMDVISIPDIGKTFRVLPSKKRFILHSISEDEAKFKLCRIEKKSVVSGGHLQLTLHDGKNILIRVGDSADLTKPVYQTLDVLKLEVPNQEISACIKCDEGLTALIFGGKNIGKFGKIITVEKRPNKKQRSSLITIEDKAGNRFQTIHDYIFLIGEADSIISLPEVD